MVPVSKEVLEKALPWIEESSYGETGFATAAMHTKKILCNGPQVVTEDEKSGR